MWLTHVDIWQKITNFCKAVILQLKNKLNFKKVKGNWQTSKKKYKVQLKSQKLTKILRIPINQ